MLFQWFLTHFILVWILRRWAQREKGTGPMSLVNLTEIWALCSAGRKNQPTEALKDGFSFKLIRLDFCVFHITELSVFLLWTWKLLVIWKWSPYVCESGGKFSFWPSTVVLWVTQNKTAEVLWMAKVSGEVSKIGSRALFKEIIFL